MALMLEDREDMAAARYRDDQSEADRQFIHHKVGMMESARAPLVPWSMARAWGPIQFEYTYRMCHSIKN